MPTTATAVLDAIDAASDVATLDGIRAKVERVRAEPASEGAAADHVTRQADALLAHLQRRRDDLARIEHVRALKTRRLATA